MNRKRQDARRGVWKVSEIVAGVLLLGSALSACSDESTLDSGATDSSRTGGDTSADTAPWQYADAGHGAQEDTSWWDTSSPVAEADTSSDVSSFQDASPAPPPVDEVDPVDPALPVVVENDWIDTMVDNLATFSVDVDTASYTLARDFLRAGQLPTPSSVRVEEFLNAFDYAYEGPAAADETPFRVTFDGAPSVFGDDLHMLRMGLQGRRVSQEDRPAANLVFLIDVSGSMSYDGKLTLVQDAIDVLVDGLDARDSIALVVYAGAAGVVLPPTPGDQKATIRAAVRALQAGGGTAGEAGIREAYRLAAMNYEAGKINRVILCTDGDFNVGLSNEALVRYLEERRDEGITLTSLLFGRFGNDAFLEQLANRANGNYYYIGDQSDANQVLGTGLLGTLLVIAKDVKVQAVLNRDVVSRYRIVGYDNRILEDDEFDDDTVDAAEIGAGHQVTAMLEVELHDTSEMDPNALVAWVQLRYKLPEGTESVLVEYPLLLSDLASDVSEAQDSLALAMGVAEFAEILRQSRHSEGRRFDEVRTLLTRMERNPQVAELIELVDLALTISP